MQDKYWANLSIKTPKVLNTSLFFFTKNEDLDSRFVCPTTPILDMVCKKFCLSSDSNSVASHVYFIKNLLKHLSSVRVSMSKPEKEKL